MANDPTTFTFLNAITTAAAGDTFNCSRVEGLQIQFWSASTSSSTVLVQGSENGSIWITLGTVTNVALAGEVWEGACMKYMRVNPTVVSSGTISALGHSLDSDPGAWHKVTQASTTPVALSTIALTMASATVSDLTTTRIPIVSTAGLLTDDATLTFGSAKLTVPALIDSSGTATRVPYYGASKELTSASTFTFTASGSILANTVFAGGLKHTIAAKLIDGAIASAPGVIAITKATPLGSSTLATPTVTAHDGYVLTIVSTTAQAHVVSCASGKVNGGTITTLTFGGAIGDSVTMVAYQGLWYVIANVNVVLT